MKSGQIKLYNRDWRKKKYQKGRVKSQMRVVTTLRHLFEDILKTGFKGKIIDLGCGDGTLVMALNARRNIKARGIDINRGIDFETDRLPFKTNEFDIAIMYSVVEHINNPYNLLTEARRIIKPRGHVIIITANFDLSNPLTYDREFYNDPTHIKPYNYISIDHLMKIYGFKKKFIGLWTVKKSSLIWKMPVKIQFYIGALLPFRGDFKFAPSFLKGRSKSMLCVFENTK